MDNKYKRELTMEDHEKEKKGWLHRWFSSIANAFSDYCISDDCCYDIYCYLR